MKEIFEKIGNDQLEDASEILLDVSYKMIDFPQELIALKSRLARVKLMKLNLA